MRRRHRAHHRDVTPTRRETLARRSATLGQPPTWAAFLRVGHHNSVAIIDEVDLEQNPIWLRRRPRLYQLEFGMCFTTPNLLAPPWGTKSSPAHKTFRFDSPRDNSIHRVSRRHGGEPPCAASHSSIVRMSLAKWHDGHGFGIYSQVAENNGGAFTLSGWEDRGIIDLDQKASFVEHEHYPLFAPLQFRSLHTQSSFNKSGSASLIGYRCIQWLHALSGDFKAPATCRGCGSLHAHSVRQIEIQAQDIHNGYLLH